MVLTLALCGGCSSDFAFGQVGCPLPLTLDLALFVLLLLGLFRRRRVIVRAALRIGRRRRSGGRHATLLACSAVCFALLPALLQMLGWPEEAVDERDKKQAAAMRDSEAG